MITHYLNGSSTDEWRRTLIDMENDYENAEIIIPLSGGSTSPSAEIGGGELAYSWLLRRQAS